MSEQSPNDTDPYEIAKAMLAALPHTTVEQQQKAAQERTAMKAAKVRSNLVARLSLWRGKDAWNLRREASALAMGLDPAEVSEWSFDDSDKRCGEVFDLACRSIAAKTLSVTNPEAAPAEWWVRPEVFARWVVERAGKPVPPTVAEIFAALFQDAAAVRVDAQGARERFVQSGYSTAALELAFQAIAELWLPFKEGKRERRPTESEVKEFLMARGAPSANMASHIDALIRLDDQKPGGILPSKGPTPKAKK